MVDENPSLNKPAAKRKVAKPKAAGKPKALPKPLVEGINTPRAEALAPMPVFKPEPVASDKLEAVFKPKVEPISNPKLESILNPKKPEPGMPPKNTSDVIFVKPTLTEQEKRLINENTDGPKPQVNLQPPRLLTPQAIARAGKRSFGVGGFLLWLLFFLVLGFSLYEVYGWYLQGHSQSAQSQNAYVAPAPSSAPQALQVAPPATSTAQIATARPSSTPISIVASPAPVKQLMVKPTPTGYLNVRSQPSSGAKVVAQVHPNEVYTYTDTKSGWYKITLKDGTSGWVSGQYVTLQ